MWRKLQGKKTYISAALMGAVGVAKLTGMDIPGFESADAGQLIGNALAFAFLRNGVGQPVERDNTEHVRGDSRGW